MSSTQSERQIPKSLQGLAKANKATGLLVAYTAAFLTLGVIDYVIERTSPTSRPVLAMHLNPTNCQCPPCASIRSGTYNSHARNVYAVPVGGDAAALASVADSLQRLADDMGDWAGKGVPNTQPAVALEGTPAQLAAQRSRVLALAGELRQKAQKAQSAGQVGSQQIGRGQ